MTTIFRGHIAPNDSPFSPTPSELQVQVIKDAFSRTNLCSVMTIDERGTLSFRPEHTILEHSFSATGTGLAEELAEVVEAADSVNIEMVSSPLMQMADETGAVILWIAGGDVLVDRLSFGESGEITSFIRDEVVERTSD